MLFSVTLIDVIAWAAYLHLTRQVIEDASGDPYMIRYFIWRPEWLRFFGIDPKKAGRIYLHHFQRSDHDRSLHDHPWNYTSLILWPGYREYADSRLTWTARDSHKWNFDFSGESGAMSWRDFGPLSYIKRGAGWRHRVVLNKGRCWTLVFCGPKVRSWGFWTDLINNKWCYWRNYDTRTGLCEESESTNA